MGALESECARYYGVGPWMLWGTDDVWVDVIMVLARGCRGQRMWDEVRVDVIIVLAYGSVERMRFGWTLSWFFLMDALGNG